MRKRKKGKHIKKDDDLAMLAAMGRHHHQQGRLQEAERIYRQILGQSPRHAASLHWLGLILHQRGQSSEALDLIRKSVRQNPGDAEAHNNLGNVLRRLGRPEDALGSFRRAIRLAPGFAGAYNNMGLAYRQLGQFEEAARQFRLALGHEPALAEAWSGLARTGRSRFSADEAEAARQIFDSPRLSDADRRHIAYALGKHYDASGEYDRAFLFYEQANQLTGAGENRGVTARIVGGLLDADFSPLEKALAARESATDDTHPKNPTPVFIFGMPRSGTTLVEQILSSHADIAALGELNVIDATLRQMRPGLPEGNADALARFTSGDCETLRRAFFAAVKERVGASGTAGSPRPVMVSDKSLLNFAYVPILRLAFPDARFVHCRREARDTCLSVYFTDFRAVYDFTSDLGDIGRFHVLYRRTMEKWAALLPGLCHDIDYENIIDRQETETRRLLEYAGLPWDPACLSFFETRRQIATPSDWQVRLPVFTSSRGRWRHYARHLTRLHEALADTA